MIAWDVPAGNELMEHGKTGYLVQPYDVTSLGQQIISVLNDPEGQTSVTEAAYEKLKSYFNLERMVDETISFYKDALS